MRTSSPWGLCPPDGFFTLRYETRNLVSDAMPDLDSVYTLNLTELGRHWSTLPFLSRVVDIVSLKTEYVQSCFSQLTWLTVPESPESIPAATVALDYG
jgi:hypothetical protein